MHYSNTQNFNTNESAFVDVPYASGPQTQFTASINSLNRGQRYYVKVIAYSALVPPGSLTGARSEVSQELTVEVP